MDASHHYEVDDDDGARIVFVCPVPGCGRRVVLVRGQSRTVVIDQGDFAVPHTGAVGPITISLSTDQA